MDGGSGGSYNDGTDPDNRGSSNREDGYVTISCIADGGGAVIGGLAGPPPAELCDDGVANSDDGSCRNDCTRSCSRPPPVDGMTVSLTAGLAPGSVATFSCAEGQVGDVLTCRPDGTWSGAAPAACTQPPHEPAEGIVPTGDCPACQGIVHYCGGRWFSKAEDPNVDASQICQESGFSRTIAQSGGTGGTMCRHTNDHSGSCDTDNGVTCGTTVSWQCQQ